MKLTDLARAAAAFTLAWAAFAQLPGKSHARDAGSAAPAWPISRPRIPRPLPPAPPPAIVPAIDPVVAPIAITAVAPAAVPAAVRC